MNRKPSLACYGAALCAFAVMSCTTFAQTVDAPEYVSPFGLKFYAQKDENGVVAEAEKKLAADPKNIDLLIALGRAQASVWRYRDAIATYTRGIEMAPKNPLLYRHRGHRYITLRQFDKAVKDLELAAKLNDKDYDIWYHLALAYYLKGDFKKAAKAYEKCRGVAANDDSLIAVSDWLYMTYRRANEPIKAEEVLSGIRFNMQVEENKSYYDRLLMYKGYRRESDIVGATPTDLDVATIGYGIGNWYFYNEEKDKAKAWFNRVISGKYWPAFGFIASEVELQRMK